MSIELKHILLRNKSNLKLFIRKNKLTSFQDLLDYCEQRNFIPCTKEEYSSTIGAQEKRPKVQDAKKDSGTTSQAQKPKRRYRRKKKQAAPKLPDSTDKR